jgi:hypothetical protein
VREEGVIRSQAVLLAIGIGWDGRRSILAVELANGRAARAGGTSCWACASVGSQAWSSWCPTTPASARRSSKCCPEVDQPAGKPERGDQAADPRRPHLSQPRKLLAPDPGARGRDARELAGRASLPGMDDLREHKKEALRMAA